MDTPCPAAAARGASHDGRGGRGAPVVRSGFGRCVARGRDRDGAVVWQLALGAAGHGLLRAGRDAVAAAAHLVARGGGAVLPRLAASASRGPRGQTAAPAGAFSGGGAADGAPSELRHGLLLLTALAGAALVAGVVLDSGHPVARLLSTRLLVGIGRISYGLYLWHWPVYLALDGERSGLHGYVLAALRVAVTGVLAGASFVLIERPAQRLRVRPRRVLPPPPPGAPPPVLLPPSPTPPPRPPVAVAPPLASGLSAPLPVPAHPIPRSFAA